MLHLQSLFTDEDEQTNHRVRHHDHITGNYIGPAHNNCNLKLRLCPGKIKIPVVFHNLRGYDSHLIISAVGATTIEDDLDKTIHCIPNNMEKYMTFSIGQLQFIDSYQFMADSLDNLSRNLQPQDMRITAEKTKPHLFSLMTKKGIFPYDWLDSMDRMTETSLPPRDAFYSRSEVSLETSI